MRVVLDGRIRSVCGLVPAFYTVRNIVVHHDRRTYFKIAGRNEVLAAQELVISGRLDTTARLRHDLQAVSNPAVYDLQDAILDDPPFFVYRGSREHLVLCEGGKNFRTSFHQAVRTVEQLLYRTSLARLHPAVVRSVNLVQYPRVSSQAAFPRRKFGHVPAGVAVSS